MRRHRTTLRHGMTRALRLCGILAIVLLAGCSSSHHTNLAQWVTSIKSRPGTPLPPLPVIRTPKTFAYDTGLVNPFLPPPPPHVKKGSGVPSPDPNRPRQPLEHYALKQLAMVGTMHGASRRVALVRTPDGVIHMVAVGQYMGKHDGKVMVVHANTIEIEEVVADGNGGWRARQAVLQMASSLIHRQPM